mgnify:CR=1 FL=1
MPVVLRFQDIVPGDPGYEEVQDLIVRGSMRADGGGYMHREAPTNGTTPPDVVIGGTKSKTLTIRNVGAADLPGASDLPGLAPDVSGTGYSLTAHTCTGATPAPTAPRTAHATCGPPPTGTATLPLNDALPI